MFFVGGVGVMARKGNLLPRRAWVYILPYIGLTHSAEPSKADPPDFGREFETTLQRLKISAYPDFADSIHQVGRADAG
jgi:hypothetical protein